MNLYDNLIQTVITSIELSSANEISLKNDLKIKLKNNFDFAVRNGLTPEKWLTWLQ